MICPGLPDIRKSPPMKPLLLFMVLALLVSCSVPPPLPSGIPLDKEHRPGGEDTAITRVAE